MNERDGTGSAVTAGGQTFEGAWRDGAPHGQGVAAYEDGGRYEGSFLKGLRAGWGTHAYGGGGGSYTGQWAGDAPHGTGKTGGRSARSSAPPPPPYSLSLILSLSFSLSFPTTGQGVQLMADGARFEGTFTSGARAMGRWLAAGGGEEYEGDWDVGTGLRSGTGVRVLPGASTYSGAWAADHPHGRGRCEYADGTLYEGAWQAGVRVGRGRAVFPDGSTYEGWWADDAPHGRGRASVGPPGAGGGWYEGDWSRGARHGQGRERTADGEVYAGGWVGGVRAGVGTARTAGGEAYAGEWAGGKRHGLGEVRWGGGGTWRGRWAQGKWVASPPHPPSCEVGGAGLSRAVAGRRASLRLLTRDRAGQACLVGGARVAGWLVPGRLVGAERAAALMAAPPGDLPPGSVAVSVEDGGDGTYALSYTPSAAGEASLVLACGASGALLLADAPYAVFTSPGPPDARACWARLEGGCGGHAALVTARVDVRDGHGNTVGAEAAAAATRGLLRLGGATLPALVEALPAGGVLLRVPIPLPGQVPVVSYCAASPGGSAPAALEVTVGGRHVPGTPLAVALVGGGGGVGHAPTHPPVPADASRAWAARAAAALAELGEQEGEEADNATPPLLDPAGRPLDPATAAYSAAHPGVPVVEDLNDLWLVGRLQRERERKKQDAAALEPGDVELARQEMAAKLAAEKEEG